MVVIFKKWRKIVRLVFLCIQMPLSMAAEGASIVSTDIPVKSDTVRVEKKSKKKKRRVKLHNILAGLGLLTLAAVGIGGLHHATGHTQPHHSVKKTHCSPVLTQRLLNLIESTNADNFACYLTAQKSNLSCLSDIQKNELLEAATTYTKKPLISPEERRKSLDKKKDTHRSTLPELIDDRTRKTQLLLQHGIYCDAPLATEKNYIHTAQALVLTKNKGNAQATKENKFIHTIPGRGFARTVAIDMVGGSASLEGKEAKKYKVEMRDPHDDGYIFSVEVPVYLPITLESFKKEILIELLTKNNINIKNVIEIYSRSHDSSYAQYHPSLSIQKDAQLASYLSAQHHFCIRMVVPQDDPKRQDYETVQVRPGIGNIIEHINTKDNEALKVSLNTIGTLDDREKRLLLTKAISAENFWKNDGKSKCPDLDRQLSIVQTLLSKGVECDLSDYTKPCSYLAKYWVHSVRPREIHVLLINTYNIPSALSNIILSYVSHDRSYDSKMFATIGKENNLERLACDMLGYTSLPRNLLHAAGTTTVCLRNLERCMVEIGLDEKSSIEEVKQTYQVNSLCYFNEFHPYGINVIVAGQQVHGDVQEIAQKWHTWHVVPVGDPNVQLIHDTGI